MSKRPSKKLSKVDYQVPGGPTVRADATPAGVVIVHESPGGRGGYVVVLAATGEIVSWARLVTGARALQKQLEALDWADPGVREAARSIVLSQETTQPKEVQPCDTR